MLNSYVKLIISPESLPLKLSRLYSFNTLPGRWFQSRMAAGKKEYLYGAVLVCCTSTSSYGLKYAEMLAADKDHVVCRSDSKRFCTSLPHMQCSSFTQVVAIGVAAA